MSEAPPGQKFIPNFIIYRILGQPNIRLEDWRLVVDGEVDNKLVLDYDSLLRKFELVKYVEDFHCVTGWSVRRVAWEGVRLKDVARIAEVREGVRWVYVTSLDGYTTTIAYKDFVSDKAILALKINGKVLSPEQGFPARIFIPHLYGWKGAKWVFKLTFMKEYRDGYWEALGYHERGNVWSEERFKRHK